MKFKDLFKVKKEKKDNLKNDQEVLDVPKVEFANLELQGTIGQWLGVLSSRQSVGNSFFSVSTHLSVEELIKKVNISEKQWKEVETKFAILLKLAGIPSTETCILGNLNKDDGTFECVFKNSEEDANIAIRWGDMLDYWPELTISYQNESKTYDYFEETKDNPMQLRLNHYKIKNPTNGNSCYRYLSEYTSYFTLKSGEYSLKIEIKRPESVNTYEVSNYTFRLENEEELQKYLLNLTFPLDINEVYKKIREISVSAVEEYPSFKLKVTKELDEKNIKITDMMILKDGQLENFIMTKEGKTIEIDSVGNWTYNSQELNVSQNDKGNVSYMVNLVSKEELGSLIEPLEQYNEVSQEVEQVRKLTQTMIKR